jgi:DNA-binding NtrC family response regulator
MQSAAAMADGPILEPDDQGLAPSTSVDETSNFDQDLNLPLTEGRNQLVENFERRTIQRAIEQEDDNVGAAARGLRVDHQCLQQKIKQPGLR